MDDDTIGLTLLNTSKQPEEKYRTTWFSTGSFWWVPGSQGRPNSTNNWDDAVYPQPENGGGGVHNPTTANSRLWISVDLYPTHMQPMVLEYAHQHDQPIYYTWSIWGMNSGFSNIDQYSPGVGKCPN